LEKYVHRGDPILVEGKLGYSEWNDKTTNAKRSKLFVKMQTFTFLPNGNENGNAKPQNRAAASQNNVVAAATDLGESTNDDFDPLNF